MLQVVRPFAFERTQDAARMILSPTPLSTETLFPAKAANQVLQRDAGLPGRAKSWRLADSFS